MPIPLPGDRAAHDAANYPSLHSSDMSPGAKRKYHLPVAEAGQVAVSNGAEWIPVLFKLAGLLDVDLTGLTDGQALVWDAVNAVWQPATIEGGTGGTASGGAGDLYWLLNGALAAVNNAATPIVAGHAMTISEVILYVDNLGTSGATTIDVNKNGASIFGTKPSVAYNDADKKASVVPTTTSLAKGDVLTLDIDAAAVGAASLSVCIVVAVAAVSGGTGDMEKATYDTDNDGIVDNAAALGGVAPTGYALAGHAHTQQVIFTIHGDLEVNSGEIAIPNHTGRILTISAVYLRVHTAPTGADLIADIHKDGSTLFPTQANRPEIAANASTGSRTGLSLAWADGEYLSLDVDQVGSTVAGASLTVTIVYA